MTFVTQPGAAVPSVDPSDRATRALGRISQGIADSLVAAGVATAPAAGAAIATLAAPPAGKYEVRVYAGVSNAAVADLANFELQRGGLDLVSPLAQGASGQSVETVIPRVDLNGAQNLTVNAIGVGTAAIEYAAIIVATRVE